MFGLIGLAATVPVSAIFGLSVKDTLLLKEPALAPFLICDYVFLSFGAYLGAKYVWLLAKLKHHKLEKQ